MLILVSFFMLVFGLCAYADIARPDLFARIDKIPSMVRKNPGLLRILQTSLYSNSLNSSYISFLRHIHSVTSTRFTILQDKTNSTH